ncbi:Glycosyl transferases group 1 [Nocardioides terrae]|uniref:Glycosyl transferases group 1 n=1 Tax=Nocardioides terrae TaxID=574651 RepID=A0A1I1EL20_9ACTN|nr:glycosyltransferase [Nocardioides terrae]SFB87767.1 Glycosyl transferases group 1 [Nocardioides terrae]
MARRKVPLRVALLNNYSTRQAMKRYIDGQYPGQHLWGVVPEHTDLDWRLLLGMYDVSTKSRIARRLRAAVLRCVGDPLQQASALRSDADVIVAADQWSGSLVGLLRRLHIVRRPYVAVVHHAPSSWWNVLCLKGADDVLVLSPAVGERTAAALARPLPVVLPWGPDLDWALYRTDRSLEYDFVSAGKTNRDHATLRDAVVVGGLSGVIFDGRSRLEYLNGKLKAREDRPVEYPEIIDAMARARAVVVPLSNPRIMAGLTEMADAFALGVPVVATKSAMLPYEIDSPEVGVLVTPGSSDEIVAALRRIGSESARRPSPMAQSFNMEKYQEVLVDSLRAVLR